MRMEVRLCGTLVSSSPPLKEGLSLTGRVRGRVDPLTLTVEKGTISDLSAADLPLLHGDATAVMAEGGRLKYAAPDISGHRDLFYSLAREDRCLLGDDFFEFAKTFEKLAVDKEAVGYFVTHGYFPPGATYFREIRRVRAGHRLAFGGGSPPREENLFELLRRDRPRLQTHGTLGQFRKSFRSILNVETAPGGEAVLLSGGCDSALIAAVGSREWSRKPQTFTMRHQVPLAGNGTDVKVAKELSELLNLEHEVVEVDLDTFGAGLLNDFVGAMPLAAHLSVHLYTLLAHVASRGFRRFWSGQNADSVYNLGPTKQLRLGDGKEDLIKRFFMSGGYISALPDVNPGSAASPLVRLAGRVGAALITRRYGQSYLQPDNFNELFHSYRLSDNYLVLKARGSRPRPSLSVSITSLEARERLFDEKLGSFLVGRDARVVTGAAALSGLEASMPFSAPNLLIFFRDLEMTWKDVIRPKRFIHGYLRELIGEEAYARIYRSKGAECERNALPRRAWDREVLGETRFGRELAEGVLPLESWCDFEVDTETLQYLLSLHWYRRVRQVVQEAGVTLD